MASSRAEKTNKIHKTRPLKVYSEIHLKPKSACENKERKTVKNNPKKTQNIVCLKSNTFKPILSKETSLLNKTNSKTGKARNVNRLVKA